MPDIATAFELWLAAPAGVGSPSSMEQLSDAIERAFRDTRRPGDWLAVLTAAYIEVVGLDKEHDFHSDPDTLINTLSQAVPMFRESLIKRKRLSGSPSWLATLAESIDRHAVLVFNRAEPVAVEKATAIRLAALCLAQDADEMGAEGVGHMFRRIAAGITLLERRASGTQPAVEAIMLTLE